MIDSLITDTLTFIQENFEPDTYWLVKKSEARLQMANKPEKELPPILQKIQIEKPPAKEVAVEEFIPTPVTPPKEPSRQAAPLGVNSLSSAVKKLFPTFSTSTEVQKPHLVDPALKKALSSEVVLFSFRESKESDLFLQNLGIAISSHFLPSSLLDVKKWELSEGDFSPFFKESHAKLIIAPASFYKRPSLLPFFKEMPASSERYLGSSKLLLLNPFEDYFNNPLKKKELWHTLCTILKNSLSSSVSS